MRVGCGAGGEQGAGEGLAGVFTGVGMGVSKAVTEFDDEVLEEFVDELFFVAEVVVHQTRAESGFGGEAGDGCAFVAALGE